MKWPEAFETTIILRMYLSGYAQPEDLKRFKAAGFNQHLAKPMDLDTLKIMLAEIC